MPKACVSARTLICAWLTISDWIEIVANRWLRQIGPTVVAIIMVLIGFVIMASSVPDGSGSSSDGVRLIAGQAVTLFVFAIATGLWSWLGRLPQVPTVSP